MEQKKLLYVEDETGLRNRFSELFLANGYNVVAADCEDQAKHLIYCYADFDCAVFDVELGENPLAGVELCREFREKFPLTPVLILSAHTDTGLQEMSYKLGADAYVDKREPLSLLAVRLDALVERHRKMRGLSAEHIDLKYSHIGLEFDELGERVFWNGNELSLSPVRTAILKQLFLAKGKAVSVFDLQDELKIVVESNTIVQHIKIIRSEFQRVDPSFNCIRTVRGKGYRWVAPVG
ncbi:hypothetical protein A3742_11780 [Oleiphilus sp. HI0071]|nr:MULTISPECIES: response regulator transcription factor [unclassified Oleiphilus]KZY61265.1 hypothetical protein A3737_15485 [Oleiphilus sp. HI0065]KZY81476.1 hypothetical protein A3742_11780 [Oleiphilus sp. HI0071]KZY91654.1 hypothetical protein A3744_14930 [Oleiphilus sp. HI0073]KZZ50795.1 hypothetical protein A3758_29810 [Oleiphilus sp. HI0118]KZZ61847.1 hypothetical protein A3760_00115 [Oleiphilus sp. HI0122]KZZ78245.1 hypothetical protein A3767_13535 [Oleiphilus sp. HI0133]